MNRNPFDVEVTGVIGDLFDMIPLNGVPHAGINIFSNGFRTNVIEKEDTYIIESELPGFAKDKISVDIKDKVLTITAENEKNIDTESERILCAERRFGKYTRTFGFKNASIDEDNIKAKYIDGILMVEIPKLVAKEPEKKGISID